MTAQIPDPEQAYQALRDDIAAGIAADSDHPVMLVGIHTGGAWVAKRLARDLQPPGQTAMELGFLSSAFHRDDYAHRGLPGEMKSTSLPLSIDDARIILIDDILFTGRTVRAALNELFDHGRPSLVELAVLVDRGGRQLPFAATYCGAHCPLESGRNFQLDQNDLGRFSLKVV